MDSKEMKLAVINDVLEHLDKFNLTKGNYCSGQLLVEDPQVEIEALKEKCDVCALGALFLTHIGLYNSVDAEDITFGDCVDVDSDYIRGKLEYFSSEELRIIEYAFEGWELYQPDGLNVDEELTNAVKDITGEFRDTTPRERLIKILKHMLQNDGEINV